MIKIGVICPSEIALRRFMPALKKNKSFQFIGIGVPSKEERFKEKMLDEQCMEEIIEKEHEKAQIFIENYGGKIFGSYTDITNSNELDALYIPLPPALHFKWARQALQNGKHVLIEKPATLSEKQSYDLIKMARVHNVALHENYMFIFHNQLNAIDNYIKSGSIGDVRLIRISFGFPRREVNDFRYNKELGGGALFDAGGYTIRYASILLGNTARIVTSKLNYTDEFDVDIFGSATMENDEGKVAQISFGMDNSYKCDLEVWGSKGSLISERVLTAPEGFIPNMKVKIDNVEKIIELPEDDTFYKSIEYFKKCIDDEKEREKCFAAILKQARYVDDFQRQQK